MTDKPAAHRRPSAISEVVPPHFPSTRTGTIFDTQLTPATPTPLLPAAPIVPDTCVPCQELFMTGQNSRGPPGTLSASVTQSPGSCGLGSRPSLSFASTTSDTKS